MDKPDIAAIGDSAAVVTIEKGTTVYSTAPGWPSDGKPSGRQIKLISPRLENYGEWGRIVWAGSGGYWRWIYIGNRPEP